MVSNAESETMHAIAHVATSARRFSWRRAIKITVVPREKLLSRAEWNDQTKLLETRLGRGRRRDDQGSATTTAETANASQCTVYH